MLLVDMEANLRPDSEEGVNGGFPRELRAAFGGSCIMTFMPASTRTDRRDLILARAEAARLRRIEEGRIREARAMVERFFGLDANGATP
jgi:hypothetical protein